MYRKDKNEKDVRYILEHLREEDRHEAIIQKGENYIEECLNDIMNSSEYFVLGCKKSDDTPVCMGGCTAAAGTEGIGIIWLLSTPEVVNHQICLLKNIRKDILSFDEDFWLTFNFIYSENYLAKNWLKRFGFKFDNPIGVNVPKDFEFFYRTRKVRGLGNANRTTI